MKSKERIKGILLAIALGVTSMFPQTGAFLQGAAKTAVVKNQQELDKALKNKMLKTIVVKSASKKLKIKKGNYNKVKLEVNSAKTRIINSGKFNQITIKNADTFTEKASDNTVKSADSKLKVNVKKAAQRLNLTIAKKNSNTTIAVAGSVSHISLAKSGSRATVNLSGNLESAAVESASELIISGSSDTAVAVALTADGASFKTDVRSNVDVSAKTDIVFEKGAEDSEVSTTAAGVDSGIVNNTEKAVVINATEGKTIINAGSEALIRELIEKIKPNTESKENPTEQTSGGSSGGGGGGGYSGGGGGSSSRNSQASTNTTTQGSNEVLIAGGTIKFVLSWGEGLNRDVASGDLDSHLIGPGATGDGNPFHVYFHNKRYDYNDELYVDLASDKFLGDDAEITTIYKKSSGEYHFYVHDYGNNTVVDNKKLSGSKAKVQVYADDQLKAEYNIPTDKTGTLWDVCSYDTRTGILKGINDVYFHYGGSSDVGIDEAKLKLTYNVYTPDSVTDIDNTVYDWETYYGYNGNDRKIFLSIEGSGAKLNAPKIFFNGIESEYIPEAGEFADIDYVGKCVVTIDGIKYEYFVTYFTHVYTASVRGISSENGTYLYDGNRYDHFDDRDETYDTIYGQTAVLTGNEKFALYIDGSYVGDFEPNSVTHINNRDYNYDVMIDYNGMMYTAHIKYEVFTSIVPWAEKVIAADGRASYADNVEMSADGLLSITSGLNEETDCELDVEFKYKWFYDDESYLSFEMTGTGDDRVVSYTLYAFDPVKDDYNILHIADRKVIFIYNSEHIFEPYIQEVTSESYIYEYYDYSYCYDDDSDEEYRYPQIYGFAQTLTGNEQYSLYLDGGYVGKYTAQSIEAISGRPYNYIVRIDYMGKRYTSYIDYKEISKLLPTSIEMYDNDECSSYMEELSINEDGVITAYFESLPDNIDDVSFYVSNKWFYDDDCVSYQINKVDSGFVLTSTLYMYDETTDDITTVHIADYPFVCALYSE